MAEGPPIIMVGAGGHALVVAEATGGRVVGHLTPEDQPTHELLGPWLGSDADADRVLGEDRTLMVGLAFVDRSGALHRAAIIERLGSMPLASVVHERAVVAATASLSDGVFVAAAAVVGTQTYLGRATIVNTGAVIDHDGHVGANVHVGPGATLSGGVIVGDDTLVGVGATIRQGVRIGARVVVGAGAVVVSDVPDDTTVFGVPARAVEA